MEGSGKMNAEDGKDLSATNRKKTVKTPFQVEALEKFYDEHNYPTEVMKLELAENIGMSEKQVSSWFCYRRLKDKRLINREMYAKGRQDRPSVVVHDSCGTTKKGGNKTRDPIEVQRTRFNSQQLTSANAMLGPGSDHDGYFSRMDDNSSGSPSSPDKLYSNVYDLRIPTSKLSAQNAVNYVNVGKPRSGPSGYLKVKGLGENPAVTAVKMLLGADYRVDGPPIGIVFEPLPPEAFEPSGQQPENTLNSSETYSTEEQVAGLSPVAQGIHQEFLSKPALDGKDSKTIHKSVAVQTESFVFQKHKQEFSVSKHSAVDMHDDLPPHMAVYGAGGSRRCAPAGHDQLEPYGGEVKKERVEPWLENSNGMMPKVEQGASFSSSYSDFMVRGRENDAYGDKGLSRKEAIKVDNIYGVEHLWS